MTETPVGLSRTADHVYTAYYPPAEPVVFPISITAGMKSVDKSGPLVGWAKRVTAEAAVRNLDMIAKMAAEGGQDAAIAYLKGLADHKRDTRAAEGSVTHALIEAVVGKQPVEIDDTQKPYMAAFDRFDREWEPVYLATEYMVCSMRHGYAGTGDLVVAVRCPICVGAPRHSFRLDTKTMGVDDRGKPKGPYKETALQLAAAEYAEFCGMAGDPKKYAVPEATHCGVLSLHEDGTYAVTPYAVDESTFEAFLDALAMKRWLDGPAKTVMGQPLRPVAQEIAA